MCDNRRYDDVAPFPPFTYLFLYLGHYLAAGGGRVLNIDFLNGANGVKQCIAIDIPRYLVSRRICTASGYYVPTKFCIKFLLYEYSDGTDLIHNVAKKYKE